MENSYFSYLAIKTFHDKESVLSYERIRELQGYNLTPNAQDPIGDLKYILLILSRIVPDLVYDITTFERIPITIPEILTLIEGITIGGHRTVDVDSTNNIIRAYKYLINLIKTNPDQDLAELYRTLHTLLSVNLIDTPGQYRKCKVRIGGASDWSSVDCERIPEFVTQLFA